MIREGSEIRVKVGTGEVRPDTLWVEVTREAVEGLDDWSAPVRCKMQDGVLVFRRSTPTDDAAVHIGRKNDDDRWPKPLPPLPLGNEEQDKAGREEDA